MMKKLLFTLATAIVLALPACGQNAKKQKTEMKTLVAYFSATGTTEAVARNLAAASVVPVAEK